VQNKKQNPPKITNHLFQFPNSDLDLATPKTTDICVSLNGTIPPSLMTHC